MSTTSLRSADTVLRAKRRPQSTPKAPNPTATKPLNTAPKEASEPASSVTWWRQPASVYNSLVATVSLPFNARADEPVAFSKNENHEEVKPNEFEEANRKPEMAVDPPPQKPSSRSLEYAAYLNPVGYLETRYTRMMSSLSSIAYRMDRLTPAYLRRMHNIELRHTSLACEIGFKSELVSPERQMAEDVDILGDGMAGMAPSFTETALIEEVQQPQRPPEPISSASELAAARAYDHFHPAIPRSSTAGDSMDSDRPTLLEGYTVWSPSRPKSRHRRSPKSKVMDGSDKTKDDASATMATYTRLAEGQGSVDTDPDHQHSFPPEIQTSTVPSLDFDSIGDHGDGSCPNSPRRYYESEPLLVGALADRAQWWDYDASAYSDMEADGMLTDVDDHSETSSIDGSRPQNDMFCALDMLSRVWPNKRLAASRKQAAAAETQSSDTVVDEDMAGPELKDFAGGMEGDIMQAAANSTASMNPSDAEEVGYLEKLRQRVLAVSTVKEVTFAAGAARKPPRRAGVPKPDTRDSEGHSCPVHWFVADDPSSNIRFFSLQGSDSLDSWRANLSFDPVTFEDASLGVSVHRGMYEAALALYPRFAPMVAEHLASSPFARISFTGHSLGGSISTILAIMMVHRKLVRPSQLSPLYTFGAAACFCEADHVEQIACGRPVPGDETDVEADNTDTNSRSSSSVDSGLLRSLGIPCDTVRNIILTHDIVPRAFACDYTPVAAMLRQVFTQHLGLQCDDRSIMYHFVGRLLVLQPDEDLSWVYPGEGHHPLLPKKAGLYELIEPDMLSRTRQLALSSMDALESLLASESRRRPSGATSCNNRVAPGGGSGAGFLPSAWLRRRGELASGRSTSSAAASDDATCSAVEGYPSPCSQPLAATAALGRQAYWQSLATRVPLKNASTFTIDLEAQIGPDLTALLSPFSDRSRNASSPVPAPPVPPSVPFSTIDEADFSSEKALSTGPNSKPLVASSAPAIVRTRDTLHHAELAMLDTPHPLKVLADPGAYGDHGMISRFHHPDHYTQALGSVVRSNLAPLRRVVGRVNMSRFSTLLRARLRRLQADPMAAWHSAVWDLQAVIAAEGERLDLRPSGPVFGTASLLERTGINMPELPNKFP